MLVVYLLVVWYTALKTTARYNIDTPPYTDNIYYVILGSPEKYPIWCMHHVVVSGISACDKVVGVLLL